MIAKGLGSCTFNFLAIMSCSSAMVVRESIDTRMYFPSAKYTRVVASIIFIVISKSTKFKFSVLGSSLKLRTHWYIALVAHGLHIVGIFDMERDSYNKVLKGGMIVD